MSGIAYSSSLGISIEVTLVPSPNLEKELLETDPFKLALFLSVKDDLFFT